MASLVLCFAAATHAASPDVHLVIQGCSDDGHSSEFWTTMFNALKTAMPFTSASCPSNMAQEQEFVDTIMQQYQDQASMRNVIIVSALVQPEFCLSKQNIRNGSSKGRMDVECWSRNDGSAFALALSAGATGLFIENAPNATELTEIAASQLMLDTASWPAQGPYPISMMMFESDNFKGGYMVGNEFCDLTAKTDKGSQVIVLVYGPQHAQQSDTRMEGFKAGLEEQCGDSHHEIRYKLVSMEHTHFIKYVVLFKV
jgi:hypothetical protein